MSNDRSGGVVQISAVPMALVGMCGMLGACTSGVLFYPLDTVRTRLQLQFALQPPHPSATHGGGGSGSGGGVVRHGVFGTFRAMFLEEHARSFYRGLHIHVAALSGWAFVYFGMYNALKRTHIPWLRAGHPVQQAGAAGAAWATSVLLTNPLWILKTRAQVRCEPMTLGRIWGELGELHHSGKLLVGASAAMWGAITVMIQLPLYEHLKLEMVRRRWCCAEDTPSFAHTHTTSSNNEGHSINNNNTNINNSNINNSTNEQVMLTPRGYIVCTSISMTVSSLLTYPQDVVRARLQGTTNLYAGAWQCVRSIWAKEGLRGMYAGIGAHLLRLLPTSAVTFLVYEHLLTRLHQHWR